MNQGAASAKDMSGKGEANEFKRYKFSARIELSSILRKLDWESYDFIIHELLCRHYHVMVDRVYDLPTKNAFTLRFPLLLSHQTASVRVVDTATPEDFLAFRTAHKAAFMKKGFYFQRNYDDAFMQLIEENNYFNDECGLLEIVQPHLIAQGLMAHGLDIWVMQKLNGQV